MPERRNAAPGLIDGLTADLGGPRTRRLLERLDAAVPWAELAKPIRRLYKSKTGRPPWSAELMLRSLLLAKWFSLSDPQLEECLQDRLSFRRFVGLSLTDTTPDETTFVVFRRRLREAGLQDVLFDRVVRHIEKQGLLVRDGTLVDATILDAPSGAKREDGTKTSDDDASYTVKHGTGRFGYKGHIAVDRSGIVTNYALTTAKMHDIHCIDELAAHEQRCVIADSAYMSKSRRESYAERGVLYAAAFRRTRGQKELEPWQRRWNTVVAKMRATAEHPFAMVKQQCGLRRTRYRGLARNSFDFCLTLIACNIKRSLSLSPT